MASCKKCGTCCRTHHIQFKNIQFDDKWIEGRGGRRVGFDVFLPATCKWLTEDNLCAIHESGKPHYCKIWPRSMGPQTWLTNMGCRYFD